jgi:hypothetical protein
MPLRDHFRPPIFKLASWEGLHGGWPMTIVQRLVPQLPPEFTAEPRVHLGNFYEIDVCAFERDELYSQGFSAGQSGGGVATAIWAPPEPTLVMDVDPTEQYAYEVLVFDQSRDRTLVAAVELVSPANKDRPESRRAFVAKCAAMLQQGICVSIVDLVTIRNFNLYAELMDLFAYHDPRFHSGPPATYAATCRSRKVNLKPRFETWAYPLVIGEPLPMLPLWLTEDRAVSLDLEASYEDTCRALRIA